MYKCMVTGCSRHISVVLKLGKNELAVCEDHHLSSRDIAEKAEDELTEIIRKAISDILNLPLTLPAREKEVI